MAHDSLDLTAVTRPITSIAIHCAYTPASMDVGVAEIKSWHLQRGFSDIGYHFVIRRQGQVETGRDLNTPGAHVKGHNARSIGICLVGGKAAGKDVCECNFTAEQQLALTGLLNQLRARWPNAELKQHRDYPGVAKPCACIPDLDDFLAGLELPPTQEDCGFWPGIDFFRPEEFKNQPGMELLQILDDAREAAGVPFYVESNTDDEAVVRIKVVERDLGDCLLDISANDVSAPADPTSRPKGEVAQLKSRIQTLEQTLDRISTAARLARQK